jgi:hypothetical protein
VALSERTVTNLLDRYEELVALRLSERARLRERLGEQGRVVLAIDGLQPDVGHEVCCGSCATASRGRCSWREASWAPVRRS